MTITRMHRAAPPRIVVIACTIGALAGFSANSLLTRAAVGAAAGRRGDVHQPAAAGRGAHARRAARFQLPRTRRRPFDTAPPWAGAAALAGYAYAFAFAYTRIDAGTGALLLFGAVQLTMTGWGIGHGERPRPAEWLGLVAAIAGLIVLTRPGQHAPDPLGVGLMIAAGGCWGVYSLLGRQATSPLARTFTNFALAAGVGLAVLLLPLALHTTTRGSTLARDLRRGGLGAGLHPLVPRPACPFAISRGAGAALGPCGDGAWPPGRCSASASRPAWSRRPR